MSTIAELQTVEYLVRGTVQGVGFRPFVYRLARELGLCGWVRNDKHGALIRAVGTPDMLQLFETLLMQTLPIPAHITEISKRSMPGGEPADTFQILDSDPTGQPRAGITPDLATCPDCLREMFDPNDRRYLYPFTNCTNCGPRFSILLRIPYDRANTTMRSFTMCPECRTEYDNPGDRRFHAQPNACPLCGPQLAWWDSTGHALATKTDALRAAVAALRDGRIVALKGLGGFHLLADARNNDAVVELRRRKHREEKPLAVMMPSLEHVRDYCDLSPMEAGLLTSAASPIALLKRRGATDIAASVAPGNPNLGVMLPYTPLHHLLLRELGFPIVATSGNLSDEPICIDEQEALVRLCGIADYFLVHNRPIARPVDDSVVRVVRGCASIIRRARGYAPQPVPLPTARRTNAILAVGGHLKNTVALRIADEVFVSQHVGDLETTDAHHAFHDAVDALENLYQGRPAMVACDLHPDYASTRYALRRSTNPVYVQHHHAHIASCLADNGLTGPVLGVSWDGTGYGADGAIWGGEFMIATLADFTRVAHFRYFPLPGGDQAIREPRRAALGLLFEMMGRDLFRHGELLSPFSPTELNILGQMLDQKIGCPPTSSVGRLFDAVAGLTGLRRKSSFEGQAAMGLEFALPARSIDEAYEFALKEDIVDWEPAFRAILNDLQAGLSASIISARFHNGLVNIIVEAAHRSGQRQVALSGGCFQNAYLLEHAVQKLSDAGFEPIRHRQVPCNDGGLSLGQVAVAANQS